MPRVVECKEWKVWTDADEIELFKTMDCSSLVVSHFVPRASRACCDAVGSSMFRVVYLMLSFGWWC